MPSHIRRETFWAVSHPVPTLAEAMQQVVTSLNSVAREQLGEGVLPISVDHHVTVHGRTGDTAPSFLSSIFKDTPIRPSDARYTVTAMGIYEVFITS